MKHKFWLLVATYWLLAIFLVFYSYSQIDLNLTLSSNLVYQTIQKKLIYLGYFYRPLSAFLYLILTFLLFTFYFLLLVLAKRKKITYQKIWILILGLVAILLFAYPAFSHDIFNYIFDVRILVHHQVSPWTHTALDFPSDPWTRFMHWTHRTYPYGPFWLLASLFPYLLGFGKFVLTLFWFKLLLALSYLGSCYLVYKIVKRIKNERAWLALTLFAFNPLILIESLLSPHLDIFMTFLGLLAIFLLLGKKRLLGFASLVISILIKYATVGYLPFLIKGTKFKRKIFLASIATLVAVIGQIYLREVLPWYFIPLIALVSLSANKLAKIVILGLSLGGTLYHLPYLYIGEYNQVVKIWRLYLFFAPILISVIIGFLRQSKARHIS